MAEVVTKFGVTYTQHATTPVFTTTDATGVEGISHGLSVDDEISVTKVPEGSSITGSGTWIGAPINGWEYNSGTTYTIATIPSDSTFTVTDALDTSAELPEGSFRTIEYHPLEAAEEEKVVEVAVETTSAYKWEQKTLGQNKKIQEVVASAAKASELLNTNMAIAKGGVQAASLFLTTVMNPKVIILNTIADAIDTFVEDFLGTGFYILEVVPEGSETVPKNADGNPITLALAPAAIAANYATALGMGLGTEFKEWTTAYFGKADPNDLTAGDLKEVPQGNSKPLSKRVNDANSDRISPMEGVFGFPAMTPSQVIATMIAAIDDPLDDQRPTFSENVEVGAILSLFASLTLVSIGSEFPCGTSFKSLVVKSFGSFPKYAFVHSSNSVPNPNPSAVA